jgi:hypothetical protein
VIGVRYTRKEMGEILSNGEEETKIGQKCEKEKVKADG